MGGDIADQARELLLPIHLQAAQNIAEGLGQVGIALDPDLAGEELVFFSARGAHTGQGQGRGAQSTVRLARMVAVELHPGGTGYQVEAGAEAGNLDQDHLAMQIGNPRRPLGVQGDIPIDGRLQGRQGRVRNRHPGIHSL